MYCKIIMATLKPSLLLLARHSQQFLRQRQRYLSTTAVAFAHWNKDWKPGPIPHTPEERAAAAKKYGLRPEDYNCLSDLEVGDYPSFPFVSRNFRDPYEEYDMPGQRRNFMEPVYSHNEVIGIETHPSLDKRYTAKQTLLYCLLIMFGFVGTFMLLQPYPFFPPMMPKQYPFNNLYLERGGDPAFEKEVKHYTFEPASKDE